MDAQCQQPAVVWFRRDLRLHDHPALTAAAAGDRPVVPLFVLDPSLLGGRFASPNRTWYLLGCLRALTEDLAQRGTPLVVRVGDPKVVVPEVARLAGATDVLVSRDHGPYGRVRDQRVADALAAAGVRFHAKRGVLVHEPEEIATASGTPFRVYSPFRRAWEALPRRSVLPAPERLLGTDLDAGRIPTMADLDPGLGLGDRPTADPSALPVSGEAAARDRLATWLD